MQIQSACQPAGAGSFQHCFVQNRFVGKDLLRCTVLQYLPVRHHNDPLKIFRGKFNVMGDRNDRLSLSMQLRDNVMQKLDTVKILLDVLEETVPEILTIDGGTPW